MTRLILPLIVFSILSCNSERKPAKETSYGTPKLDSLMGIAEAAWEKQDLPTTKEAASQAVRENEKVENAFYLRGMVQYKEGNYYGAMADFSKVIQLKKNHAEAYRYRALAHSFTPNPNRFDICQDYHKSKELGMLHANKRLAEICN